MRLRPGEIRMLGGLSALVLALIGWLVWNSDIDRTALGAITIGLLIIGIFLVLISFEFQDGPPT